MTTRCPGNGAGHPMTERRQSCNLQMHSDEAWIICISSFYETKFTEGCTLLLQAAEVNAPTLLPLLPCKKGFCALCTVPYRTIPYQTLLYFTNITLQRVGSTSPAQCLLCSTHCTVLHHTISHHTVLHKYNTPMCCAPHALCTCQKHKSAVDKYISHPVALRASQLPACTSLAWLRPQQRPATSLESVEKRTQCCRSAGWSTWSGMFPRTGLGCAGSSAQSRLQGCMAEWY